VLDWFLTGANHLFHVFLCLEHDLLIPPIKYVAI